MRDQHYNIKTVYRDTSVGLVAVISYIGSTAGKTAISNVNRAGRVVDVNSHCKYALRSVSRLVQL